MKIDRFSEVIKDQLGKLGGEVVHELEVHERGYMVRINPHKVYVVSRYYSESNVATISEQLLRIQVSNLYSSLAQSILDTLLGEGKINVTR